MAFLTECALRLTDDGDKVNELIARVIFSFYKFIIFTFIHNMFIDGKYIYAEGGASTVHHLLETSRNGVTNKV